METKNDRPNVLGLDKQTIKISFILFCLLLCLGIAAAGAKQERKEH